MTRRRLTLLILSLKLGLATVLIWQAFSGMADSTPPELGRAFWTYVLIGFGAQLVDGAIGMAYGVTCSGILLGTGVPPALASAGIHTAEVFTTGVSGLSHLHFRNVDKTLLLKLAIPGAAGSALGAWWLSQPETGAWLKPWIAIYLMAIGGRLLLRSIGKQTPGTGSVRYPGLLGWAGGTLDAIGGGGWGPIVTSTLLHTGQPARTVIGTVNTAEFFVTLAGTGVFVLLIGVGSWQIVLGLMAGGVLAAPLGALLVQWIPHRVLVGIVGTVLILVSAGTAWHSWTP